MYSLIPAYGRDYKSTKEVQADLDADKDFEAVGIGQPQGYINKAGLLAAGEDKVLVRYKGKTRQGVFGLK